jgi:hypothetical protein
MNRSGSFGADKSSEAGFAGKGTSTANSVMGDMSGAMSGAVAGAVAGGGGGGGGGGAVTLRQRQRRLEEFRSGMVAEGVVPPPKVRALLRNRRRADDFVCSQTEAHTHTHAHTQVQVQVQSRGPVPATSARTSVPPGGAPRVGGGCRGRGHGRARPAATGRPAGRSQAGRQ